MGKRRQYLRTIGLPLVIALIGVLLIDAYVHGRMQQTELSTHTREVVFVTRAVLAGTPLTQDMLATRALPTAAVAAGEQEDIGAVVGRTAAVTLVPGDPVFAADLANGGTNDALSAALPVDAEALTIPASEISAVAGLLEPGDKVDLLAAFQKGATAAGTVGIVATDVKVLAVQQSRIQSQQPTPLKNLTSVTLQVTPQEGSRIFFAEQNGVLALMLRSPLDHDPTGQAYTTAANAYAAPQ